jgi:hypothetical protein
MTDYEKKSLELLQAILTSQTKLAEMITTLQPDNGKARIHARSVKRKAKNAIKKSAKTK